MINKEISNIKLEIKQSLIDFIKELKQDSLYDSNIAYRDYVNGLAEGTPKEPDMPWYNNGNLLIEPSVSYQDLTNKKNLYNHYAQYFQDLKKEYDIIRRRIERYKEWLKNNNFDYSSKFLKIETSPLTFLNGSVFLVYAYDIKEVKNGIRIIGKSYPKELNFFENITSEHFRITPMTEEDFYNYLTYDINVLKKHMSSLKIDDEIIYYKSKFNGKRKNN